MVRKIILLGFLSLSYALADGGAIQLRKQAGDFLVTLFSEPTPVRVGKADLSVLCERTDSKQAVTDAQVLIHLRRPGSGGTIMEIALPAKRSESKNGLLYAAVANLTEPGKWPVRIDVRTGSDEAMVTGIMEVLPSQPAIVTYWPFFVAVPLLALLFAINLRLRRGRALRHPRARK